MFKSLSVSNKLRQRFIQHVKFSIRLLKYQCRKKFHQTWNFFSEILIVFKFWMKKIGTYMPMNFCINLSVVTILTARKKQLKHHNNFLYKHFNMKLDCHVRIWLRKKTKITNYFCFNRKNKLKPFKSFKPDLRHLSHLSLT